MGGDNLSAVLTGVFSGLLVLFFAWLAKSIFLARRLFLIQPKLFDYSDLVNSQNSKTLELTAFNGGARSEEDVQIQLSPSFRYTIVASDAAGLTVDEQGIIRIDRLSPKQDRTVILTAEGGEFRKEHVVGIASRETVGKIKDKLQEAQLTPAQNVFGFFVFLGLLPAFGFGFGRFIEKEIWPEVAPSFFSSKAVDFQVGEQTISSYGVDRAIVGEYSKTFEVVGVTRKGDIVTVATRLINSTKNRLDFTLISSSPVSEKRTSRSSYIAADVLVFPGAEKVVEVSDYLPPDVAPSLISLEVVVEGMGDRVRFAQDVNMTP